MQPDYKVAQPNLRRLIMAKIAVYTTAAIALATLVSAPAMAELNYGPTKNGSQCWSNSVNHNGSNGSTYGYWGACPKTASVAAAPAPRVRHRTHHARS
jgi:hypothetical protein